MNLSATLDSLNARAKQNKWMRYFTVFNRVALAAGFIPSGMVKIMGERFTTLAVTHPMGNYLEALSHTGFYYTFIGIAQVTAAILLLVPRTAILGALLYFPIILNICILSLAVRFDGSLLTSPLMVIANLYLLAWDYDKLRHIFPWNPSPKQKATDTKFPVKFFAGAFAAVVCVGLAVNFMYTILPHNHSIDCRRQCPSAKNPHACEVFCDCIHKKGQPLDKALDDYNKAVKAGR